MEALTRSSGSGRHAPARWAMTVLGVYLVAVVLLGASALVRTVTADSSPAHVNSVVAFPDHGPQAHIAGLHAIERGARR